MKKLHKLHKMTKIILVLCLWVISSWQINAQEVQVQGKVTDGATNEALPGVNIIIKGTTKGVTSSVDGIYQISAPKGSTLVFSFLSYLTQEIQVGNASTIDVKLQPNVENLQEIVVIGYGTVKKEDATGSVSVVGASEFNKGAMTSPQDLIVGKTAGVVVTSSSGAPGSGSTIRIRGGSSVAASNDPLIVIDGVAVDNTNIGGSPNALASINPNDIESFTVLKDASATAIYGSRASNGVILITTKRGTKDIKVTYDVVASIYTVPKTIPVFSGDEFRALIKQQYPGTSSIDSTVKSKLGNANTNWQNEIYRVAGGQDHNLSISGTKLKTPFRVSLGYTNQDGILKTTNFERSTASINLSPSLLDDHLKLNINVKGTHNNNNYGNTGAVTAAVNFDPTQPVMNGNTRWGGYTTWMQTGQGIDGAPIKLATMNPVALLNLTSNTSVANRSIGNLEADYKLHFLPDLHANVNLAYDYQEGYGNNNNDSALASTYDPLHGGGSWNHYHETSKMNLLDFMLNYTKQLDPISSKIEIMAGYEWQHFWDKKNTSTTNESGSYAITPYYNTPTEYFLLSYFGRLIYSLKDRYLLTITLRDDNTSRFSSSNREGLFPSVALGWKIKNESFLATSKVVSDLKLRLGYGVTGQQNLSGVTGIFPNTSFLRDYPYLPIYQLSQTTAMYQFGNEYIFTLRPGAYNANIKWETTKTSNIGLDYGFLNDRITGAIDYYDRKTSDLLNFVPTAAGTNLSNYVLSNVGDLENKGLEFSINAKIIAKKDFYWEVGYNIGVNKNKITKLLLTNDPTYPGVPVGGISGGVGATIQTMSVGYPVNSFYVYKQAYNQDGSPIEGVYVDQNGDGVINSSDLYRYKKPAPDALMGFSSRVTYKNWDFSFSSRASIGNYVYNNVASNQGIYLNLWNAGLQYPQNIVKQVNDTKFMNAQYYSDYYVENASFFRMDNISLGYNFNRFISNKLALRITATVQNVFVITKYKGLDPEVDGGIDNNFYPRPRTFLLGLRLDI